MRNTTEQLESLEQDGIQYAHFFSHPSQPGYYGILIREWTPEYVSLWLPLGPLAGYKLELSINMPDDTFCDYISQLFPQQKQVPVLKTLYAINDINLEIATAWAHTFKVWKQERILANRVKWLSQYPWVTKDRMELTAVEKN
jgi:hypothetical protein